MCAYSRAINPTRQALFIFIFYQSNILILDLLGWCNIKIHLVGFVHDYDIDRFREGALDWEGALAVMADDITTRLREAMDWQNEFDLATADEDHTHEQFEDALRKLSVVVR